MTSYKETAYLLPQFRNLLVFCVAVMMRGAWVEACLTVAMGVDPRRGTEPAINWVE